MNEAPRKSAVDLVLLVGVFAIGLAILSVTIWRNVERARKRAQGRPIKGDLRLVDAAVDKYAIEYNARLLPTPTPVIRLAVPTPTPISIHPDWATPAPSR